MTTPTHADAMAALELIMDHMEATEFVGRTRHLFISLRAYIKAQADGLPDGWKLVPAAIVDPSNHHNALACQYCTQDKIILNREDVPEGLDDAIRMLNKWPKVGFFKGRTELQRNIEKLTKTAALVAKAKGA